MTLPSLSVINPFDQTIAAELPYDSPAALDAKVNAAIDAQRNWRQLPLDRRITQIQHGLNRFADRREAVTRTITRQMGKPITQSEGEFDTFFARAERVLADAPGALAPDVLPDDDGIERRIEHEPLGIVLAIAAWNYPLLIPVNVIVPALVAGNVVLLKHSARTPQTGQDLADTFGVADLPNLVTNLILQHEQTLDLIADPRIHHVAFTGSVAGGRRVCQAAASRFIDVGLELGGNDGAYVAADADLEFAVANIVDGACYNAGQSCCAIERVYVHQACYQAFLEQAAAAIGAYQLGDPLDRATALGPLARQAAIQELSTHVDDAVRRGSRLLVGGTAVPDSGANFFAPTLLADVPQAALVMQEESFGPLIPVAPVVDDDEGVRRLNDSRFGLTASVWTADRDRARRLATQIQAGTVFQNRADYVDPSQPWTGWGESGRGSTLSRYGLYHLTRRKSFHFRG